MTDEMLSVKLLVILRCQVCFIWKQHHVCRVLAGSRYSDFLSSSWRHREGDGAVVVSFLQAKELGLVGTRSRDLLKVTQPQGWQPLDSGSVLLPPQSPRCLFTWHLRPEPQNPWPKTSARNSGNAVAGCLSSVMTSEKLVLFFCPDSAHGEAAGPPKGSGGVVRILKPIKGLFFFLFSSPRSVAWLCPFKKTSQELKHS